MMLYDCCAVVDINTNIKHTAEKQSAFSVQSILLNGFKLVQFKGQSLW